MTVREKQFVNAKQNVAEDARLRSQAPLQTRILVLDDFQCCPLMPSKYAIKILRHSHIWILSIPCSV